MAQRALREAARLVASGQGAAQRAALFAAPGDASLTAAMGDASFGDGGGVDSSGAGSASAAGIKQVRTPPGKTKAGELSEKKTVYRWRQVHAGRPIPKVVSGHI